jgi:hypothetical protein
MADIELVSPSNRLSGSLPCQILYPELQLQLQEGALARSTDKERERYMYAVEGQDQK